MGILIGIATGIIANQVFGMICRLLPATWVRYPVQIEDAYQQRDLAGTTVMDPVRIGPPGKPRALMEPLKEDLAVRMRCDGGSWVQGVWVQGDISVSYLTVDRSTRIPIVLLRIGNSNDTTFISDRYPESNYRIVGEGKHLLEVQIIRVIDQSIAAAKAFTLRQQAGNWLFCQGKGSPT